MTMKTHTFYKENGIWYIDLPEFLESGLGTKSNLMMVGGSDIFLDRLSGHTSQVKVKFSKLPFPGSITQLNRTRLGHDESYLDSVGHAKVDGGAYYMSLDFNLEIWLCPVTKYVFQEDYPERIYLQKIS
jgi:hypothetical protein